MRTPPKIEEKILYLQRKYHLGPTRISWYLERYHGIKISNGGVYSALKINGMNRLPCNTMKRTLKTPLRYEKQAPGHHIQVDVKFLKFRNNKGKPIRRFQFAAIDDATRIRALRIYKKHTQQNAIRFIDYVIMKFPFRIHTIRTDNGHEFQAKYHWHEQDLGINHVYIKPRSPHLSGKVERPHGTDHQEFHQLLSYKDDVDVAKKLSQWEQFYNLSRPYAGLYGKTSYEALREKQM